MATTWGGAAGSGQTIGIESVVLEISGPAETRRIDLVIRLGGLEHRTPSTAADFGPQLERLKTLPGFRTAAAEAALANPQVGSTELL